ncbi:hypothetical protein NDU88_011505 [Pleurodeles waltl]|uniref:Uncharacterized protein n=1 Tax=Pleurodeles waltl TaxID=8319 RepID=A0AAV7QXF9_PLEWA|nr:hypothetical protein NDU88_011505 [Pleurodeles waltl]
MVTGPGVAIIRRPRLTCLLAAPLCISSLLGPCRAARSPVRCGHLEIAGAAGWRPRAAALEAGHGLSKAVRVENQPTWAKRDSKKQQPAFSHNRRCNKCTKRKVKAQQSKLVFEGKHQTQYDRETEPAHPEPSQNANTHDLDIKEMLMDV